MKHTVIPKKFDVDHRILKRSIANPIAGIASAILTVLAIQTAFAADKADPPGPRTEGQWSDPFDLGIIAINASLLQNGKILFWQFVEGSNGGSSAKLWDTSGNLTDVSVPYDRDIFCGGQTHLADGRLMVIGGVVWHEPGSEIGVKQTDFFDVTTETWSPGPDMSYARWYPDIIENSDGTILAIGGQESDSLLVNEIERYDPATNTFTTLPSSADNVVGIYPRTVLLPSGNVFMTGQNQETDSLNLTTNSWSFVGDFNYGERKNGLAVLLPGLNQVLAIGGGGAQATDATATVEIIDFSMANPAWQYTAPMHFARSNANSVLLADGTVLVIGGCQVGKDDSPVEAPELFDPVSRTWRIMASPAAFKVHHSTALLLPDGRVWSAGGDSYIPMPTYGQIFSPPYLFKGRQPVISQAPSNLRYNQSFYISTPNAAKIARIALVKLGTATHAGNFDQRYVDLAFQTRIGTLQVKSPIDRNQAPPGWYMLFIVTSNGIPSVAPMVLLQ